MNYNSYSPRHRMVNVSDVKVDVSKMAITKGREAPQDSHSLHGWKRLSLRHCSSQSTLVASDAYRGWGILTVRIRYHSLRQLLSSKQTRHRFGESRKLGIETFDLRDYSYHSSCLFGLCNIRYRRISFAIHRIGEFLPCLSIQIRTAAILEIDRVSKGN